MKHLTNIDISKQIKNKMSPKKHLGALCETDSDCDTSKNLECKAGAWYKYHKTKNVKEDITTKRCVEKCNSGEVLNNCRKPTDKPGSQLVSKANCLEAAKQQFGNKVVSTRSLLQTENWDWVPKGCSVQSGGDYAAHYGTNDNGV